MQVATVQLCLFKTAPEASDVKMRNVNTGTLSQTHQVPLTSTYCVLHDCAELYLCSPIRLHGVHRGIGPI